MSEEQKSTEHHQAIQRWKEKTLQESLDRFPERRKEFITTSSEVINRLYTPADLPENNYQENN